MSIAEPIYNRIGETYNYTREADPYLLGRLRALLAQMAGGHYLDIGCGTGNYTTALAGAGLQFTGVDPSDVMLEMARQKSGAVQWLMGSAEQIPAADASFNGAIATLTVHHWQDMEHGFREVFRVLQGGAGLIIFTSTPEQMAGYWLNHYFPQMLSASMAVMPSLDKIKEAATKAGFVLDKVEPYQVQPDLKDCFLYVGKHNPLLYFRPEIRAGISSFSALAAKHEVEKGLARLQYDLEAKVFSSVQDKFRNNLGDYLFICFRKVLRR